MIYQWVYGYSCWARRKRSFDSIPKGFCTYSWTEGLSLEEIDELERRCGGYDFPYELNVPTQPTPEEIEQLFPVAYYSFSLASGRKAIVRVRYVGNGFYDHRSGAFIAHGLVLDAGEWPKYPIEYIDSPVFWRAFPDGIQEEALRHKDNKAAPDPDYLPALNENDLPVTGNYSLEKVSAFFSQGSSVEKKLMTLTAKLLAADTVSNLSLSIYAHESEVAWLFAGVTMLFPLKIAQQISFATRTGNTLPSTIDVNRWYTFFCPPQRHASFDLERQQSAPDLAWLLAPVLRNRTDFDAFQQDFNNVELKDLSCLAKLFNFLSSKVTIPQGLFLELLSFLKRKGNENSQCSFIEHFAATPSHIPAEVTTDWLDCFYSLAQKNHTLLSKCDELFIAARTHFAKPPFEFWAKRLNQPGQSLSTLWLNSFAQTEYSTASIVFTVLSLSAENRLAELTSPNWECLFQATPQTDWSAILNEVLSRVEHAFPLLYLKCPSPQVKNVFADSRCRTTQELIGFAMPFVKNGTPDVVMVFVERFLARCADKEKGFKETVSAFEKADCAFADKLFGQLIGKHTPAPLDSDGLKWYLPRLQKLPEKEREEFLNAAEPRLAFPSHPTSEYATLLEAFILNASLAQNRIVKRAEILLWYSKVVTNTHKDALDELPSLHDTLVALPALERETIIKNVIPPLYNTCSDSGTDESLTQQAAIVNKLMVGLPDNELSKTVTSYVGNAIQPLRQHKVSINSCRLRALLKGSLSRFGDEKVRSKFHACLSKEIIARFSNKELATVHGVLLPLTPEEELAWNELCASRKTHKGVFAKLLEFFFPQEP